VYWQLNNSRVIAAQRIEEMSIKKWIINKLGGITVEQQEAIRVQYKDWAVKNLTGKQGEITPDCRFYLPFGDENLLIIRDRVTVSGGSISTIQCAPWCKGVVIEGVRIRRKGGVKEQSQYNCRRNTGRVQRSAY
jgi:hypothetical protein